MESIGKTNRTLIVILLALATLWLDLVTGREVQFPLVYVLPVALAA